MPCRMDLSARVTVARSTAAKPSQWKLTCSGLGLGLGLGLRLGLGLGLGWVLHLVERLGFAEDALGLDVGLDARLQLHLERVPGLGLGLGLLTTDGAD